MDENLVKKLLKLYLCKCKLKHTFAFVQFRKSKDKVKLHDLIEIFDNRKKYLLKELEISSQLINNEMKINEKEETFLKNET